MYWTYIFCCSVTQSCPTLCDPMDCSTPGFPVLHHLPEFVQTHVHWVGDANQPSHLLSSPSLTAFNLSQHQGLFHWVGSSHQVAKVLELQLQHKGHKMSPPFFFFLNWLYLEASKVLVHWPGIEPGPLVMKAWSPNRWTAKEFLKYYFQNAWKR